MTLAYKAEYEQNPTITLDELLAKYQLSKEDLPGCETWTKPKAPTKKPKKVKVIDKILQQPTQVITTSTIVTEELVTTDIPIEVQLAKIANFKDLALDHCIKFMSQDAKFAEVKEFKDIVAIVDSLEKSYQKTDPDAGKPTINILIQNLMERFNDDC